MQLAQQNALFLKTIKKARACWEDEREYRKVVKKIENGENLKKREFDEIHQILWR